tara:strand:- start:524 stop:2074 length:1551 start_codon:yes stop_codon:yes gene_type:complete
MQALRFQKTMAALLALTALAGCDSDSSSTSGESGVVQVNLPTINVVSQSALERLFDVAFENTQRDDNNQVGNIPSEHEKLSQIIYTAVYRKHSSAQDLNVTVTVDATQQPDFFPDVRDAITSSANLYAVPCVLFDQLVNTTQAKAEQVTITHNGAKITTEHLLKSEAQALYTLIGCNTYNNDYFNNHFDVLLRSSKVELKFTAESANGQSAGVQAHNLVNGEERQITIEQEYASQKVTVMGFGSGVKYNNTNNLSDPANEALNGIHTLTVASNYVKTIHSVNDAFDLAIKVPFFDPLQDNTAGEYPGLYGNLGATHAESPDTIDGIFITSDGSSFDTKEYTVPTGAITAASLSSSSSLPKFCELIFKHVNMGAGQGQIKSLNANTTATDANALNALATSAGCDASKDDYVVLSSLPQNFIGFEVKVKFTQADDALATKGSVLSNPKYFPAQLDSLGYPLYMQLKMRRGHESQIARFDNFGTGDVTTAESTNNLGYADKSLPGVEQISGTVLYSSSY